MPIYEYACESCGHRFDITQRFSDDPIKVCPKCGHAVRRVFHPAGIIFKGSGFYINDSKKTGSSTVPSGKSDKSESDSASKPASESTSTSETKTESVKEAVSSTSTE